MLTPNQTLFHFISFISTAKIFENHENEKKGQYNQRVLDVEHGTFTPLVFGTNGGMGEECTLFLKNSRKYDRTKQMKVMRVL